MNPKKAIKDSIRALEHDEGEREEDRLKKVTMLIDSFKSVFKKDNGKAPEISHMKHLEQESDWSSFTNTYKEVIIKKINTLSEFKAFGMNKVAKKTADCLF